MPNAPYPRSEFYIGPNRGRTAVGVALWERIEVEPGLFNQRWIGWFPDRAAARRHMLKRTANGF